MPFKLNDDTFVCILYPNIAGGNHLANLLSLHTKFYNRFPSSNYINDLTKFYESKLNQEYDEEWWNKQNKFLTYDKQRKLTQKVNFEDYRSGIFNVHPYEKGAGELKLGEVTEVYEEEVIIGSKPYKLITGFHKGIKVFMGCDVIDTSKILLGTCENIVFPSSVHPKQKNTFMYEIWNNLTQTEKNIGIIMTLPKVPGRAYHRLHIANKVQGDKIMSEKDFIIPIKNNEKVIYDNSNSFYVNTDKFMTDEGSYYLQDLLVKKLDLFLPNSIHELHKIWIKMIDKSINYGK